MELRNLDIDRIYKAFSPAKEIQDPRLFAGRRDEIRDGIMALLNRGGFLAIFGLRDGGKSSIALQIKNIASGDKTLANILRIDKLLPKRGFDYIVHYYKIDKFVTNIGELFK